MTAPIHSISGVIFVAGSPILYTEAQILHAVTLEEFLSAQNRRDMAAMTEASRKENALRNAMHNAAEWRRAAGWARPEDADVRRVAS